MQRVLDRLAARARTLITRGRIISAALNPKRTLVQLSGLAGETKSKIELFLPYGMSALPTGNDDVILVQVGGSRSHLVALFADNPALRIQDLAAGEFGFRDTNGQQIVFRTDHIEITAPGKKVIGVASEWDLTGDVKVNGSITATGNITDATRSMAADRAIYNAHKHTGVQAGGASTGLTDHSE